MTLWERFIQERVYLKGVSPATVRYYRWVERAFRPILDAPTKPGMVDCIQKLLEEGVSPISVNTYLRGFKAYCLWLKAEGKLEPWKISFLKTEQKVLATFSVEAIRALCTWRATTATGRNIVRAHLVALTILDTGLRASEVLGLTKEDCDLDNLVLKVKGKGNKHRLVPFSVELRKSLFRFITQSKSSQYIYGTKNNTAVSVRNLERDFKILGEKLGIMGVRFSPHTLRHTFAVSYLRAGGNLEFLRRILGHSSILTTQKYLKSLGVEDLGAVHNTLSPLSVKR